MDQLVTGVWAIKQPPKTEILDPYLILYIRLNSKWFKDSNMNNESTHIYQEKLELQNLAGLKENRKQTQM